jgi:hypothetical protein
LFSTYHNQTNQQLFGQLTVYLRRPDAKAKLDNLINGIQPVNFPYQWNNTTTQYIANEFNYFITIQDNSPNWNGEARSVINNTTAFQLISDWSTTTTITAGVLDAIDYYDENGDYTLIGTAVLGLTAAQGLGVPVVELGTKTLEGVVTLTGMELEFIITGVLLSEISKAVVSLSLAGKDLIESWCKSLNCESNVEQLKTIGASDLDEIIDQDIAAELNSDYTVAESNI